MRHELVLVVGQGRKEQFWIAPLECPPQHRLNAGKNLVVGVFGWPASRDNPVAERGAHVRFDLAHQCVDAHLGGRRTGQHQPPEYSRSNGLISRRSQ